MEYETQLEYIMRMALIMNGIRFADQVYVQRTIGYYKMDFVIYGSYCTLVVECDGVHHIKLVRKTKDSIRDLWSIQNGFDDVLRFNEEQIRNEINNSINQIKKSIIIYDNIHKANGRRPHPPAFEKHNHDLSRRKYNRSLKVDDRYLDANHENLKPYINKHTSLRKEIEEPVIQNDSYLSTKLYKEELFKKEILNQDISNVKKDSLSIDINKLPKAEKEIFQYILSLSKSNKKILWGIIKQTSKDGVCTFNGEYNNIKTLVDSKILQINNYYMSKNRVISVFVLPSAPYLLRKLRRRSGNN